jgi:hypothetical protein
MNDKKKIASLVRMLGSDKPGEVTAAVNAIGRVLESHGRDFNDLGDDIENSGAAPLNQAEVEQLYNSGHQAGYAKAMDEVGSNGAFNLNGFHPVNGGGGTTWQEMACFIGGKAAFLHRDRDKEFARSIAEQATWKSFISQPQEKYLKDLYVRLGGK